ncbi:hypothetical protein NDU88_010496 [Pleurodeles waltl]|uniref:Uncharacterized protein n=1 Tax=Pleurodeles waltl TaxID=8319 RepID=A0AAV7RZG2_PLEWA|nr:hypothetical protein NDU88_010496 [Pleurodeles waltl]
MPEASPRLGFSAEKKVAVRLAMAGPGSAPLISVAEEEARAADSCFHVEEDGCQKFALCMSSSGSIPSGDSFHTLLYARRDMQPAFVRLAWGLALATYN